MSIKSRYVLLATGLVSGVIAAILLSSGAFGDKCFKCHAKGGDQGGDGGDAIIFGDKSSTNRNTTSIGNATQSSYVAGH